MKPIKIVVLVLAAMWSTAAQAQCNSVETITICDMTTIDGDSNGTPDGIINLYDQYNALPGATPISLATGSWYDPNFNFALDETTGDLHLWDLDKASESISDYQFQLIDPSSSCANGIVMTLNVVVGPFSGFAVPTIGANDVNVEICDMGVDPCGSSTAFDLNTALLSMPTAHANGVWSYQGSSPNFIEILDNKILRVDIPYQPGMPLVDEETFELIYTVPGILPCAPVMETRVKISAIREVFSGAANEFNLCETELIAGGFDNLNLRDDAFLVNEDVEGVWLFNEDTTGQLTGFGDSRINLQEVYTNLYQTNQRFGCETFEYSYFVESRSAVCGDKTSTVRFTIYEYLRPFQQNSTIPEFCVAALNIPNTYNLNNLLEFTTENGVLYNYPPKLNSTSWTLFSGPSTLNLNTDSGIINLSNITNAEAGTYVFRYTVAGDYNCPMTSSTFSPEVIYDAPDGCTNKVDATFPCQSRSALVTMVIHPSNYAGENTTGLQFCETDPSIASPLDLFTLMTTNGVDDPIYQGPLGNWADAITGNAIANPITLPQINGQQTFHYVYTTSTANGCVDRANLSFTVFEAYQAGVGASIDVCDNNAVFDLFDVLTGDPNTNGTWTGPNGFVSAAHHALFTPGTSEAGNYVYTVPDNMDATGAIMCPGNSATITVANFQSPNAGLGGTYAVCRSEAQIDLVDYLDPAADSGGVFTDLDATNQLSGSLLNVSQLVAGTYDFQYEIQGHASCNLSVANISIVVEEVPAAVAVNQIFCASDGATVSGLQASNGTDFNWYDSASDTNALSQGTVLMDGEDYFVAAVDANGCESPRISITVTLLPINHKDCDDCLKDGISVNGDTENDVFDLCNLPVAFPDFEINIFNRYGTIVYKGNKNTPLFKGVSNVPLTMGNMLPSGTYFYVFDPKDKATAPIQGNFYLSR